MGPHFRTHTPDGGDRHIAAGRSRVAVLRQRLSYISADVDDLLRDRTSRAQYFDRLQRTDLARTWCLLRHWRLSWPRSDGPMEPALLVDSAGRRPGLLRRRLPVRLAGVAARGALSGACHVRARRRDAANPEIPGHRGLDRRRAGHCHNQAASSLAMPLSPDNGSIFSRSRWRS